jgi:hypothetical protein
MKNLLVLFLIIGMGYFVYQVINSSIINTETSTERVIRENELEDIKGHIPGSSHDAVREVKGDFDNIFLEIHNTIRAWRIDVNTWIDGRL